MTKKRVGRPPKFKPEQVIEALKGTGGILTLAARNLAGSDYRLIRRMIDRYPEVKDVWLQEKEVMIDMAEATILTAIKGGDVATAKWYLKLQGGPRGYVSQEQLRLSGADGGNVKVEAVLDEETRNRAIDTLAQTLAARIAANNDETGVPLDSSE